MKKTLLLLLIFTAFGYGQNSSKCNFLCHNNTVVKATNAEALNGHLKHGDILLGDCETFTGNVGGACGVLSAPDYDFSQPLPIGKKYFIINMIGQVVSKGRVESNFFDTLPKNEVLYIKISGYKLKKIIINK